MEYWPEIVETGNYTQRLYKFSCISESVLRDPTSCERILGSDGAVVRGRGVVGVVVSVPWVVVCEPIFALSAKRGDGETCICGAATSYEGQIHDCYV